MNARIKKDDLASFKLRAGEIKKNKDLPVLDFVKIEVIGDFVNLTKTNLVSFVVQTTINDSEDCCFLVEEEILFNFIELSDCEYINFKSGTNKITIYDERHTTQSRIENAAIFPKIDVTNKEWTEVPKNVLDAIGVAAQIVFDDEISGIKNSVLIGNNNVAGSDGTIGFWQSFKEQLPEIVLKKDVALSVSKLSSCEVSSNESYNLFKCGSALFGFSKSEVKYVNMVPYFLEPSNKLSFTISKNQLIKWNTFCINSCKSKVLSATFKANGYRLELELVDIKSERNNNSYFDIIDGNGYFKFNPMTLNTLLKVLPTDHVLFYPSTRFVKNGLVDPNGDPDRFYITDTNKTFMSAIMLTN